MLTIWLLASADAATLSVCPGCAYTTVGGAVAAAVAGDTIELDPGTYVEAVMIGVDVTLRGLGAPADVVLEFAGPSPVVRVGGGADVTLDTLTVMPLGANRAVEVTASTLTLLEVDVVGTAPFPSQLEGGCVYADDAVLTLQDAAVSGCSATGTGGAIYGELSLVSILGGTLDGGSAAVGGCVAVLDGDLVVDGAAFTACSAFDDGGAVDVFGGSATLLGATFDSNSAGVHGGAASLDGGPHLVDVSTFVGNTSSGWSSAVYVTSGALDVLGSVFEANESAYSGTVYRLGDDDTTVSESTFSGNISGDGAGVVWFGFGGLGTLEIADSAFEGNVAATRSGAVYVEACDTVEIRGSAFVGNEGATAGGAVWAGATYGNPCDRLVIEDNAFCGNVGDRGGAAYLSGQGPGDVTFVGNVFADNVAAIDGGALTFDDADGSTRNNDFLGNSGPAGVGSAIHAIASTVRSTNDLVAWQVGGPALVAPAGPATSILALYGDFHDNAGGDVGGVLAALDPSDLVVDPELAAWLPGDGCGVPVDRLATSPLRDAGDPAWLDSDGTVADIGAREVPAPGLDTGDTGATLVDTGDTAGTPTTGSTGTPGTTPSTGDTGDPVTEPPTDTEPSTDTEPPMDTFTGPGDDDDAGSPDASAEDLDEGGCGCSAAPSGSTGATAWSVAIGLLLWARRRVR